MMEQLQEKYKRSGGNMMNKKDYQRAAKEAHI
jgi:hypothetical protein